jgi:hypothetical protein
MSATRVIRPTAIGQCRELSASESKHFCERLDSDRPCLSDLGEDPVKRPGFQRIMVRYRDEVRGRAVMPKSHVTAFLSDHHVSDALKHTDQTVG